LAVVLLYTAGLRRGELTHLTLGDYDAAHRTLLIRDTKFYKSRLVPISQDAVADMESYLHQRIKPGFPCSEDAPLLIHHHGGLRGYTGVGFGQLMRKLFREAGILNAAGRPPRIHDFRFTFAAHALLRWYRAGVDVQARLPALSAYMGHSSIKCTEYYLTFLQATAESANDRFRQHCREFLPLPAAVSGGGR
jgi:integrase